MSKFDAYPMFVSIAQEFSTTPGGRFRSVGPDSAEAFLEDVLLEKMAQAKDRYVLLCIDLDGGAGYGSSFLEEVFGGLVRAGYTLELLQQLVKIKSNDEPHLVAEIVGYIEDAQKHKDATT